MYMIMCSKSADETQVGKFIKRLSGSGFVELGKREGTGKVWTNTTYVDKAMDKANAWVEKNKKWEADGLSNTKYGEMEFEIIQFG